MHPINWLIVAAYLIYVVVDGIRRSRNTTELEGYFLANRSLPWWAIGLSVMATQLSAVARALPDRINADPERVEQGLARLVLTVIEVVRKVLEHQAVRRMDGGGLSEEEVERLGLTLLKLNDRMEQLKGAFGLTDEDLQIDLGPLGRLR